jgi:hypothetical protein
MPVDSYDPKLEIQIELVRNNIQAWKNTAYDASLRGRIAKKMGDDDEAKRLQAEVEKAYKRIDLLTAALEEVEAELAKTKEAPPTSG